MKSPNTEKSLRSPVFRRGVSLLAGYRRGSYCAMVRRGNWKLVEYLGCDHPQLFNLADDPAEQTDLGVAPEHQELAQSLSAELVPYWDGARVKGICERQAAHSDILRGWGKEFADRMPQDVWEIDDIQRNNYFA